MKIVVITFHIVFFYCSLQGQDSKSVSGDWMRVRAEYTDGQRVPNNHEARTLMRYQFTDKEVYNIFSGQTYPMPFSSANNILRIGPALQFRVEEYNQKTLTLVEKDAVHPIRYHLIPTDSFQISGFIKYKYEATETDTIYTSAPGIEPIFPKGQNEFIKSIVMGFGAKGGFKFSFVVLKDGTIGEVNVLTTTNSKLNKRLIKLVRKSSGEWIPATLKGQPINVRQESNFSIGNSPSRY